MISILRTMSGMDALLAGVALIITVIVSLGLHEFGHAFVAYKNGDMTAKSLGRMTPNPLAHIDPIGLICCFLFGFGWANPVPINPLAFRNYKKGMVSTSLAGVLVNFVLAFVSCGAYIALIKFNILNDYIQMFLYYLFYFMFSINITLFVFNLVPIYPLDGFRVLDAVTKNGNKFVQFLRNYGTIILIALMIFGDTLFSVLVGYICEPMVLLWSFIFGI